MNSIRRAINKDRTSSLPSVARAKRRIASSELLGDEGELVIEHSGQEYRLRRTRQGKLILTK